MENWRRFLNEQEERGIRLPDDQVCMRVEMETGENAQFTMYTPGISESIEERILGLRIIGSVNLENMDESGPCLTGNLTLKKSGIHSQITRIHSPKS